MAFNGGTPALANHGPAPVPFPGPAQFSAYANGTALHVDALTADVAGPRLADVSVANSTASMATAGLASPAITELNIEAQPAKGDKEAFARGSSVEVGLGSELPLTDPTIPLAGRVDTASHPAERLIGGEPDEEPVTNEFDSGLAEATIDVPASSLAFVKAATGQSQSIWNPDTCILGAPTGFGRAFAAKAELIDTGTTDEETGEHQAPLVSVQDPGTTEPVGPQQNAVDTRSFTYLIDNKDGSFGVVSETRQTYAPISVAVDPETGFSALTIKILGEWVFRTVATGHAPATFQYGPDPATLGENETRVISVEADGVEQGALLLQDLFDQTGLVLPAELAPLVQLAVGEDPRAIAAPGASPDPESAPTSTITEGSGAVDVVRLKLLTLAAPDAGPQGVDLRIGHMESRVTVPDGGIRCPIPVSKTGAESVTEGEEFTWTISIPKSATAMLGFGCDLVNITARDHVEYPEGRNGMTVTFLEASNGGVISGETVNWANLGSYHPGDPPIVLTLKARVDGVQSTGGLIQNIVDVSANLGNCTGGAVGTALIGAAKIDGTSSILGTGIHPGTRVAAAQVLPATGSSDTPMYAGLAIASLLTAAGVYRLNRKSAPTV